MERNTQMSFMYLFERIGEPLYFGPRGGAGSTVFYDIQDPGVNPKMKDAGDKMRKTIGIKGTKITVKAPRERPDLKSIFAGCPKSTIFSYFTASHRQAAAQLREIMLKSPSQDDFLSMACYCRDIQNMNPKLWLYAFSTACHERLKGLKIPAIWEVLPDQFVGPTVVREANKQAVLAEGDRQRIEIPRNNTGNDSNPENLISYFREDVGINSHHWHWHLIYLLETPLEGEGKRDRKGELFYWMHHDILARYDAERLANGLGRVKPFDLSGPVPEGYFPKLYDTNSGIVWGSRQEGTTLRSVDRVFSESSQSPIRVNFEEMKLWKTRIFEAIDTGMVILGDGKTVRLTAENGVDILGNIIEAATPPVDRAGFSNYRYYGDFHGSGHLAIAFAHDPYYHHQQEVAVMGDPATAMRDPVFYRWHKHIDGIFDKHKATLPPYELKELVFPNIRLTDLSVQTEGQSERDLLETNWMESDIDLARGLDFGRINVLGPVWASVTHLNHKNFTYRLVVQNSGRDQASGVVRIFMAPRLTENRKQFEMAQQRLQFIAMDRFSVALKPGENVITRRSTESSLTIPWEQTFRDLERTMVTPLPEDSICGCGWPQHMLLPRGTTDGMVFDLYALVTNGAEDLITRTNPNSTESSRRGCQDSVIYCGLIGEKYPDKRPMGYPFDRYPRLENNRPIPNLEAFVKDVPNSKTVKVRIFHRNVQPVRRPSGAPEGMPKLVMSSQPSSPAGSPKPSRIRFPDSPPADRLESNDRWGNSRGHDRGQGGGARWNDPYQGYDRHRDKSPTSQRGWPKWSGDE